MFTKNVSYFARQTNFSVELTELRLFELGMGILSLEKILGMDQPHEYG